MKNVLKTVTLLAVALVIALPLTGQETKKKKKGQQGGQNATAAVLKKVKDAGADAATVEKVEALAKEYAPKLAEASKGISPETRKKVADARKAAQADGKKGKDLQAAVESTVKLTDDEKAAQQKVQQLTQQFNAAVAALLTPEQREKAGIRAGKKKKN